MPGLRLQTYPGDYLRRISSDFNVADQADDFDSLLVHYRQLIHARSEYPALQTGKLLQLPTGVRGVYAFLRYSDEQILLVVINLTDDPIDDYPLCLQDGNLNAGSEREILHGVMVNSLVLNNLGGFDNYQPVDILEPYSTYIIELK